MSNGIGLDERWPYTETYEAYSCFAPFFCLQSPVCLLLHGGLFCGCRRAQLCLRSSVGLRSVWFRVR